MNTFCNYLFLSFILIVGISTAYSMPPSSAKVLVVKGTASYGLPGKESSPLTDGTILSQGDSIVTGKAGVVHLVFSNGAALTIEGGSNLVFSELIQEPFSTGGATSIVESETSTSKTRLELRYGSIRGQVNSLQPNSEFRVATAMGDILASGNLFFAELYFDLTKNSYILNVQNINGIVGLSTSFSGSLNFGRKNLATKAYNTESGTERLVNIPPNKAMSIIASALRGEFINSTKFPRDTKSRLDFPESLQQFSFSVDQEVSPNGTTGVQP